ncbi:hypothetical protein [Candidatus Marithrix sp. Canyon 246]|uniref:hypothetical protein n=1 Tax=Candidatus Marithrix sp. Canyon 246 TaxID=1827136 RepID=UPI00084A0B1E|nr:hypothetical protein [Candidatus Marithrix sp. Canyon 246]
MEGCAIVGIDGLKIEPLPDQFLKHPIRNYSELKAKLDNRITTGFGGTITIDKAWSLGFDHVAIAVGLVWRI